MNYHINFKKEIKNQNGTRINYIYKKKWSETKINSNNFKNPSFRNPNLNNWIFNTEEIIVETPVVLGKFCLS